MPLPSLRIYQFGDLTLDLVRGSLRDAKGDLALRRKSFVLLTYFVTHAGRLLSKDELMAAIWPGIFVSEESLAQCVKDIRRAMGDGGQALIKTVPGRGYLFDAPVTMVAPVETAATEEAPPVVTSRRGWFTGAYGKFAAAALVLVPLCLGVAGWLALYGSKPAAPRLSIVVLPFVNLSNDPDQDYFADGITDNLTTDVSYIQGSFVIARETAFTYKGKPVEVRKIGHDLGVRYLLEGSVQRSENQIRINTQLIDTETGAHHWAETFDRQRGDLFAIEDEITARIARALYLQFTSIEAQRAERQGTSTDAMDYVMRGNAIMERPYFTKEKYVAAIDMFEHALQLERLPDALAGLADALSGNVLDGFSDAPENDLRRSDELVSAVLAANPNNFLAHAVKAQILRAQKRYDEAIVEYETAIALNPTCLGCLIHLARAKILIGEPAAAIPLLNRALLISPRDPQIGFMHYRLGLANLLLGNTDEAIRWYKTAVLIYYERADAYLELGAALSLKGETAAAQAALAEAAKLHPERMTIASVRKRLLSERPKFVELWEQTIIEGLRKLRLPEE